MVLLHILLRRTLLRVGILPWWATRPLVGTWKTILRLLVLLGMLATSHVGAWLLGRWWRESGAHLR